MLNIPHQQYRAAQLIGDDINRASSILDFRARYGLGHATVYRLIAHGRLRAVKLGRRTLILAEDEATWLKSLPTKDTTR
jgi:excisionase family DNA binding protein